jgi:hypothetical protein
MTVRRIGFFRELPHGDENGPSIHDARGRLAAADQAVVARYLSDGTAVAATGGLAAVDVLAGDGRTTGAVELLTDGHWVWPSDLAYYAEHYAVDLPAEFLAQVRANDWQCPEVDEETADAVVKELIG